MKVLETITRRTVLAGQAALAVVASVTGVGIGKVAQASTVPSTEAMLPPDWATATEVELRGLIGQRFRLHSAEHGDIAMKLMELSASNSGPDRPSHLKRREGVTAVFHSPDDAPLVQDGYGTYRISHPRFGAADVLLAAVPRRNGGHELTVVLN